MATRSSIKLANAIRRLMMKVEQTSGVAPENPELKSLKRILKQRLHELEIAPDPEHPQFLTGREAVVVDPSQIGSTPISHLAASK
jgi:hypothetical protein